MEQDTEFTRVIFRKFRGKNGEVFAVFPDLKEYKQGEYTCYAHIGQHGICMYPHSQTQPAKPAEYADLFAELESIGYRLKVIKRLSYKG